MEASMRVHLIVLTMMLSLLLACGANYSASTNQPQTRGASGFDSITEKEMSQARYDADTRSLHWQRVAAREEKRAGGLEAQVKRLSEELKTLREQCPQHNLP